MWWLIAVLAAVTLATHDLYGPLSSLWPDSRRAAEEIYYVGRGVEGLVLFAALLFAADRPKATDMQLLALLVICVYGAAQESLTVICGVAYMVMTGVGKHANDRSAQLCDAATGWSWVVVAAAVVAALFYWSRRRAR